MENKMNNTLRDSREVLNLIDKMQGKRGSKEQDGEDKLLAKFNLIKRMASEQRIDE
jgi:hypothetical protein